MRATLVTAALRGLQRRFWIVGATTVAVCAALAAQAAAHVVEARYLTAARPEPAIVIAPESAPPPIAPPRPDASGLVERNMFCSDCAGGRDPGPAAGELVPASTLPIALIATSLGAQPWATLRDPSTGAQGAYGVGDRIWRAGVVVRIAGTWIDVLADAAGRVERIAMLAGTGPAPAAMIAASSDAPASAYADRVRKLDDHTYEVDRRLVRDLVAGGKVDGVRVIPMTKDNKLSGIKVVQARPTSIAGAVGLRPGDVIEAIDGRGIESPQQVIDMLARLDDIARVTLEGSRRGAPLTLVLELR